MFKFFKEIRKVFHNSTGNSQGSILHEYFNWQDPLRIINFLRLRQAQQFLEGYSAKYYQLNLHLTIVWIKTFQSNQPFRRFRLFKNCWQILTAETGSNCSEVTSEKRGKCINQLITYTILSLLPVFAVYHLPVIVELAKCWKACK